MGVVLRAGIFDKNLAGRGEVLSFSLGPVTAAKLQSL